MSTGKGAMVWKLRNWQGGDPQRQVAQVLNLGLNHVSIKIVDGRWETWEGNLPNQNKDLLPGTINALRSAGIEVTAWGWTYGGRWIGVRPARVFQKSAAIATEEGRLAGQLCRKYAIKEFWIDAEAEYNRSGMDPIASAYMIAFESETPLIDHYLCSYRFPKTYQRQFPVDTFATYMEGWAPQVYFLGDSRPTGGATQLEMSFDQYAGIRALPYIGVAPTYQWRDWRASGVQLREFFQRALDLGCPGFSVWDLPQANQDQLDAIKNFPWPVVEPPIPPPGDPVPVVVTVPTGKAVVTVREV